MFFQIMFSKTLKTKTVISLIIISQDTHLINVSGIKKGKTLIIKLQFTLLSPIQVLKLAFNSFFLNSYTINWNSNS